MTQEQLADAATVDRSYLGKIETGDVLEPGLDTLKRIARSLAVPLRSLAEPMGWYDGEELDTDWVIRMRGDPELSEEAKDALEELARQLRNVKTR